MTKPEITEAMIFECVAAAQQKDDLAQTAASFVDVEEFENRNLYPEFARWAEKAGHPELASLFRKAAGEEKLHAVWLRELYQDMGQPARGEYTDSTMRPTGVWAPMSKSSTPGSGCMPGSRGRPLRMAD